MKILFTDLDGTLLNEHSEISDYTKRVLDEFTLRGNILVLASGRPLKSILQVKEKAGINYKSTYITAYNGCLIFDCDGQQNILELRLDKDYVDIIQRDAEEFGLHIHTYTDGEVVSPYESEEIKYYRQKVQIPLIVSRKLSDGIEKSPFKMLSIHLTDYDYIQKFETYLNEKYSGKINTLFSNTKYLEIFNHKGGKGNAVKYLCEYLNIPIENSYAAGDAPNDISMIRAAGTGIAMKNASMDVKESADVITEFDNANDGLARFIESIM